MTENSSPGGVDVLRNAGYGLCVYLTDCVEQYYSGYKFTGRIVGTDNIIPGTNEADRNQRGAFCPCYPSER